MRRIRIIGSSGTGKSTLARTIGGRLGLPVIHMDAEFWRPGWVETPQDEWRARQVELVAREAYVMDGNYSGHWDVTLAPADAIIWLDLSRWIYFPRALWRNVVNFGQQRSDLGEGCREQFDWKFYHFVWTSPQRVRSKTIATLDRLRNEKVVVVLRSPAEVRAFEAGLPGTLVARA